MPARVREGERVARLAGRHRHHADVVVARQSIRPVDAEPHELGPIRRPDDLEQPGDGGGAVHRDLCRRVLSGEGRHVQGTSAERVLDENATRLPSGEIRLPG